MSNLLNLQKIGWFCILLFKKDIYVELHDSSTYKFLDFSSSILFLIIIAVTTTHVSLKHVLAHDPRARTARTLKVE